MLQNPSSAPDDSWARRETLPQQGTTQHELYPNAHAQGGGIDQILCARIGNFQVCPLLWVQHTGGFPRLGSCAKSPAVTDPPALGTASMGGTAGFAVALPEPILMAAEVRSSAPPALPSIPALTGTHPTESLCFCSQRASCLLNSLKNQTVSQKYF